WGVLWLWDQAGGPSKRNTVIVWNAPLSPIDVVHRAGGGVLFDPKDPALKGANFHWAVGQKSGAANLSPLRQTALDICSANLPAFPDVKEPPNCLEKEAKTKTASGGTGCGGFPGWLINRLGAEKFPQDKLKITWQETVKKADGTEEKVSKTATVSFTDPTIA